MRLRRPRLREAGRGALSLLSSSNGGSFGASWGALPEPVFGEGGAAAAF